MIDWYLVKRSSRKAYDAFISAGLKEDATKDQLYKFFDSRDVFINLTIGRGEEKQNFYLDVAIDRNKSYYQVFVKMRYKRDLAEWKSFEFAFYVLNKKYD